MSSKPHTPASMRIRVPVRAALKSVAGDSYAGAFESDASFVEDHHSLVLVALSGGADSLALAAAVAAEAPAAGVRAGAVVVDHGLQTGSAEVAAGAAAQARALGLEPVLVRRVNVGTGVGGPEAAARLARYKALAAAAGELAASAVFTAHTRDDQSEQVLLALARGSGTRSIAGIPPVRLLASGILILRPLLDEQAGVTRGVTEASCAELGLEPWCDPLNLDRSYARVRVRADALPLLEQQLGHGFAAALARSADLAREDADALDALAEQHYSAMVRVWGLGDGSDCFDGGEGLRATLPVAALHALPAALSSRVIRLAADRVFNSQLTREHTLAIASLVTAWKGQGPIHAPRIVAFREGADIALVTR